jgi:transcriptional regulator with XRE-family HTH domain
MLGAMKSADRPEQALANAIAKRHSTLREDLVRLREDAGISRERLARAAGVDPAFVRRIEAGLATPTIATYQRLADALGADLSTRIFANTGPALRDHTQAPMLELLLATRHVRFAAFTEVGVRRPSRGWIDAVLHDSRDEVVVASELQGQLRRLEQQIRWHAIKAASLPSWAGWDHLGSMRTTFTSS